MSIKDKEAKLLTTWKLERGYPIFTFDGVFDEETYLKQATKVLFVLKEADWPDANEDVHLVDYLLSEISPTYWKTWNNIARWAQALLEGGEYPEYVSKGDKTYWLKRIAFVNLKKVPGGSTANTEEISKYVQNDALYLRSQIELYTPDIIICCGRGEGKNADLLYNYVLKDCIAESWSNNPIVDKYNYFKVLLNGKLVPVVSFVHPQMRGNHEKFKKYYEDMLQVKVLLEGR